MSAITKPIADLVRGKENVNLMELAKQRRMLVNSCKTKDGSSIKLLTNNNELDCIVMKNGKVQTARGIANQTEETINDLYHRVIGRFLGNADGEVKAVNTVNDKVFYYNA